MKSDHLYFSFLIIPVFMQNLNDRTGYFEGKGEKTSEETDRFQKDRKVILP